MHDFHIHNEGDQILELTYSGKSCSCATGLLSSERIAPGEKGTVRVGYLPEGGEHSTGDKEVYISLTTNDPAMPRIVLKVQSRLVDSIEVEPRTVELSPAKDSSTLSGEFDVIWYDGDYSAESVVISPSVPTMEFERVPGGLAGIGHRVRYRAVVGVSDAIGAGIFADVYLRECQAQPVRVRFDDGRKASSRLQFSPAHITLGRTRALETYETTLTIDGADCPENAIVSSSASWIHAVLETEKHDAQSTARIVVHLQVPNIEGFLRESIEVRDEGENILGEVSVIGYVSRSND